ncbi:MAG: enolase C-terminal domain-like protein, partial [Myxococcota bacterium]
MPIVRAIEGVPLFVPLVDPFVLANARLDTVRNLAVRVVLSDGTEGWGEVGTLHPITEETWEQADAAVRGVGEWLPGRSLDLRALAHELHAAMPTFAATRAGIEQACWDAVAKAEGIPLHRRFGTSNAEVVTDVTVPICAPARAAELGALWRSRGFATIKLKVGGELGADLARMDAIWSTHPSAGLVLDANEGWSVDEAMVAVAHARSRG